MMTCIAIVRNEWKNWMSAIVMVLFTFEIFSLIAKNNFSALSQGNIITFLAIRCTTLMLPKVVQNSLLVDHVRTSYWPQLNFPCLPFTSAWILLWEKITPFILKEWSCKRKNTKNRWDWKKGGDMDRPVTIIGGNSAVKSMIRFVLAVSERCFFCFSINNFPKIYKFNRKNCRPR